MKQQFHIAFHKNVSLCAAKIFTHFITFFVHITTWIVLCAKWLPWPLPSHQYRMNTCLVLQVQLTVSNQETSFSRIMIPRWIIFSQLSQRTHNTWWRHQMETFSVLLAICAGNSPVPGEFPAQRPVTRSFDVFFDLRLNKLLSKQSWGWWFETLTCPLWRHRNDSQGSLQHGQKHDYAFSTAT